MILYLLILLLGAALGMSVYRNKIWYRTVDGMLDCILEQEQITVSGIREGQLSALAHKAGRIQEVLGKQAERAREEKAQVKSLVSDMSHQLKTPLASLLLYTEILCGQPLDEAAKRDSVAKIRRQTARLDWLTSSLSKMVKLEQNVIMFEPAYLPVRDTLLEAIDTVYGKIEAKGLDLVTEEFSDRMLYHNKKWTAEVFVNILENAVKYTKKGGTIRITVHPYEIYTEIRFTDNGCGIPQDELGLVFRRFYRSPRTEHTEGCGIGLYLSALILEKEKGYVTAKSVCDKGSSFSVFLQNQYMVT